MCLLNFLRRFFLLYFLLSLCFLSSFFTSLLVYFLTYLQGADFHRAMVATAPAEELFIGRRPVRNWTQLRYQACFCAKKLHLFLRKSTKTTATRAALFDFNMHQIVCRLGLCPRSHWGSLQRSPRGLLLEARKRKG